MTTAVNGTLNLPSEAVPEYLEFSELRLLTPMLEGLRILARAAIPHEAVGFIGTKDGQTGHLLVPAYNHAADPRNMFYVEPYEVERIVKALNAHGARPLALYHSHVKGAATPSETDLTFKSLPMIIIGPAEASEIAIRAWEGAREVPVIPA